MVERLRLAQSISLDNLRDRYWLKLELICFCKKHGLSTVGSKHDLEQRIEIFLVSGDKGTPVLSKRIGRRDSQQSITCDTLVVNYKNDAATRLFFVKHIGQRFRFDAYLRQFTNQNNITKNLTYGDLINGWLVEEVRRSDTEYKSNIGKQFEYNQFIRDFFAKIMKCGLLILSLVTLGML
ncbi:MAG TPA: cytoplasmic protein [Gammaproteobacteria bacterium]|jgi:hypothetical protein|nr:cytoplasmic protein [Gammaproteobacteria bacterium]